MLHLLSTSLLVASICFTGTLSQYAPNVFERVVRVRQAGLTAKSLPKILPPTDGFLAVLDCSEIGTVKVIHYLNKDYTMLVADCAGDAPTRRWMTKNNILGEVDYGFAKRVGKIGVAIKPATVCHYPIQNELPIDK